MKKISREEFERLVQDLIDDKITRRELAKHLSTTVKTLNYKIDELAESNPELYKKVATKIPYVPRDIHIDAAALAIEVIKYGKNEISDKLGISIRTISRKVKELESTNPELYELYLTRHKRRSKSEKEKYVSLVESFDTGVRPKRSGLQEREEIVKETLKQFKKLVEEDGLTHRDAAKKLGYAGNTSMWCMYQDLERIQLAKQIVGEEQTKSSKEKDYRDSLKVEIKQGIVSETEENSEQEKIIEDIEK